MRALPLGLCVFLASLAAVVPSGGASGSASAAWPQTGGSPGLARTNRLESDLSRDTVTRLSVAWHVDTGFVVSSPLVGGGVVYVLAGGGEWEGRLYAIDERNGRVLWRASTDQYGAVALVDSRVVVTSVNSKAQAFAASSGRALWTRSFGDPEQGVASPTVFGRDLFVTNSTVVARIGGGGRKVWSRRAAGAIAPAVDAQNVYVAAGPTLVRLDRASGKATRATKIDVGTAQAVAIAGDRLYLLLMGAGKVHQYTLQAREKSTGKLVWTRPVGRSKAILPSEAMLAVGDELVYTSVPDGFLYAVDGQTGTVRWRASVETTASSPILANGVLYVVDGPGRLLALDASSGKPLWAGEATPFANIQPSSPTVVNGAVLVGGENGLTAFRPSS